MIHFARTHVRHLVIGLCVLAVAAVGITLAALSSGGSSSSKASAAPTTSPTSTAPATGKHAGAGHRAPRLRGTITSIAAANWTVTTTKGRTITVDVTAATRYGTAGAPSKVSSFTAGETVVVLGARHGTTVTATRIAVAPPKAAAGSSTSTTVVPAAS